MLKIIKTIINKNCKHKEKSCTYEVISEHTNYEHQHCHKCHKNRKIINSCGNRIEMEWE